MKSNLVHLIGALGAVAAFAPAFGRGATATAPTSAIPAIISGQILTPTITVTKPLTAPKISVTFSAPGLLSEIDLEFNPPKSVGLAPSHLIQYFAAMPSAQSGTVVIQNPDQAFGLYSEPGDWQLDNVQIDDNTGHSVSYDKAKLAKLFPSLSLRVVNTGPVDFRGPNIVSGQILTPTVSNTGSSTSFFANVSVTDNLSGAYDVSMLLIPPAGAYYYAYGSPAAPILSGTITAGANLPSAPTGTWTIGQVTVCDAAQNCIYYGSPSLVKSLFGTTTFQVTN